MSTYPHNLIEIDMQALDMPLLESAGYHGIEAAIPSMTRQTAAFHISYVCRYEAIWMIEGASRLCIPSGSWGIIGPDHWHQGEFAIDHPNIHFWFYFRPQHPDACRHTPFPQSWMQHAQRALLSASHCSLPATAEMKVAIEQLLHHMQYQGPDQILWLRSLLAQIFLHMVSCLQQRKDARLDSSEDLAPAVEQRILEWKSSEEMANYFGMERSQFHKIFKQSTGLSPWAYIIRARCRFAGQLLQQTDRSVTEIAFDLNFSSSQHFASTFKKIYGYTPREFRQML